MLELARVVNQKQKLSFLLPHLHNADLRYSTVFGQQCSAYNSIGFQQLTSLFLRKISQIQQNEILKHPSVQSLQFSFPF